MRPILSTLLHNLLFRQTTATTATATAHARKIPVLEYPVCRRRFTYSSPHFLPGAMDDRLAETKLEDPCENQQGTLKTTDSAAPAAAGEARKDEGCSSSSATVPTEEKLPKLSTADYKVYNSMAVHMDYFHDHFRQSWNLLYQACVNNKRPSSMSLKQFVNTGLQFCSQLAMHHAIEEQHVFPMLAAKMPEFRQGRNAAELLRQHEQIHAGMDLFEEYLKMCRNGETELDLRTMKAKMDSWGTVLWTHLDQEVKTLGAENMRKYWTLADMRRMPG